MGNTDNGGDGPDYVMPDFKDEMDHVGEGGHTRCTRSLGSGPATAIRDAHDGPATAETSHSPLRRGPPRAIPEGPGGEEHEKLKSRRRPEKETRTTWTYTDTYDCFESARALRPPGYAHPST